MFYVYVVNREKELGYYIGFTSDLRKRLRQHSTGRKCKLIYYESYLTEKLARRRELQLKQHGGAWRALIKRLDIK